MGVLISSYRFVNNYRSRQIGNQSSDKRLFVVVVVVGR